MARRPSPPAKSSAPVAPPTANRASPTSPRAAIQALLQRAQLALLTSQGGLGVIAGASIRTGQRWAVGQTVPAPFQLCDLAAKVHPVDPTLAADIAAAGGSSLEALGLVEAPSAPAAPPPAPALPPPEATFSPPRDRVVDSIVCAAADAMDMLPRQIRPALLAAFTRARELGIAIGDVESALAAPERKTKARAAV